MDVPVLDVRLVVVSVLDVTVVDVTVVDVIVLDVLSVVVDKVLQVVDVPWSTTIVHDVVPGPEASMSMMGELQYRHPSPDESHPRSKRTEHNESAVQSTCASINEPNHG